MRCVHRVKSIFKFICYIRVHETNICVICVISSPYFNGISFWSLIIKLIFCWLVFRYHDINYLIIISKITYLSIFHFIFSWGLLRLLLIDAMCLLYHIIAYCRRVTIFTLLSCIIFLLIIALILSWWYKLTAIIHDNLWLMLVSSSFECTYRSVDGWWMINESNRRLSLNGGSILLGWYQMIESCCVYLVVVNVLTRWFRITCILFTHTVFWKHLLWTYRGLAT